METCIYALICPLSNQIKYIGKSNDPERRLKDHMRDFRGYELNKALWIRDLKLKGLKPELEILDRVDIKEWEYWEKFWISYYRSVGAQLLNIKEGGQGLSVANWATFKKGNIPWNKNKKNEKSNNSSRF